MNKLKNSSFNFFKKIIFVSIFLVCNIASAAQQDPPPVVMLKNTSDQMITELNKHLGHLKNNDALISSIIKRTILPHFDLAEMSQTVVGRNYWQQGSPELQQQFIHAFTEYVIRTYSSAIESYDGETIKFYPIRGDITGQSRVQINTDINHKDGPPVHVQYRVVDKNSTWLIYDFSVDGVSLVRNYQSQFVEPLNQGGLPLLVKKLQEKNASFKS
jgi:phospholipid transport system substrate-binding protein